MNILGAGEPVALTALLDYGDAGWGWPEEDFYMLPPSLRNTAVDAYREMSSLDEAFDLRLAKIQLAATLNDIDVPTTHPHQPRGRDGLRAMMATAAARPRS
jgi:hypothetical protein